MKITVANIPEYVVQFKLNLNFFFYFLNCVATYHCMLLCIRNSKKLFSESKYKRDHITTYEQFHFTNCMPAGVNIC